MSELRFSIDSKKFIDTLNLITLKGKYPTGISHKMKSLSDYVYIVGNEDNLEFYNADNTASCSYKIPVGEDIEVIVAGESILDIPKTIKYLKTFSGTVNVFVEDFVTLTTANKVAKIPYVLTPPCYAMIEHIRYLKIPTDGTMPIFGKNNTKFEAQITLEADALLDAAHSCEVIGKGRYLLDFNGETFTMSSPQDGIEGIAIEVPILAHSGEEATVELAGPFAQFFKGPMAVFLKDDFPALFISPRRMLIKAPRITGR